MTRIESGALEVRLTPMPLQELVDEALGNLGGALSSQRVRIDTPADLPMLRIDHVLASQVLANLFDNAVRVSPAESVIRVTARVAPGSPDRIEIGVSDEGPGIAPGERERVFEMFSQNCSGGRAGLGLAIAKAFVEAHGGRIWIDPEVARGTRIVFTMPGETLVAALA
jgi:two-component system sensor histidine kinase KdpD